MHLTCNKGINEINVVDRVYKTLKNCFFKLAKRDCEWFDNIYDRHNHSTLVG